MMQIDDKKLNSFMINYSLLVERVEDMLEEVEAGTYSDIDELINEEFGKIRRRIKFVKESEKYIHDLLVK